MKKPASRHSHIALKPKPSRAMGAVAVGAFAVGALAIGALAIGSMAIGRLAVGRLAVGNFAAKRARIDSLSIGTLHIERIERHPPSDR